MSVCHVMGTGAILIASPVTLYRLGRVVTCIPNWKLGSQDPTVAREQRLDFVKKKTGKSFPCSSATSAMYCCWPGRLM
jgi:hypothetical protein